MKKIILLSALANLLILINPYGYSQSVGVNTLGLMPDVSALLDIDVAGMSPKGVLIPRITLTSSTDATTIATPANSLLVYNTGTGALSPAGYYYNQGTTVAANWIPFLTNDSNAPAAWLLSGNSGTTPSIAAIGTTVTNNFIGTTDTKDIVFASNSLERMRITSVGNIGIGTVSPNSSAIVEIASTTQGFAMPGMTTLQRLAIVSPLLGLQVFDTDLKGYYFYNGTNWDCATTPAGTVNYFAINTAPIGYLECNGQLVSTTTYPELFTAIGYLYGGAGAAFQVPDLRGEFVRGIDNGRGVDAGRVFGTTQTDALQNMTGTISGVQHYGSNGGTGVFAETYTGWNPIYGLTFGGSNVYNESFDASRVARTSTETRPVNVALLPCIKY